MSKLKGQKKENWRCKLCGSKAKENYDWSQTFCNSKCHEEFRHKALLARILIGEAKGYTGKQAALSRTLKRHLKETRGSACSLCGWDGFHPIDNKSLTEFHHVDGNCFNCDLNNIQILCPNCHSMTHNFKARNKNRV